MSEKELAQSIGKFLKLPDNRHDFALHLFLKDIAKTLKNNQALKIPDLGVFQYKKENLIKGQAAKSLGDSILFVPFTKPGETKSEKLYTMLPVPDSGDETFDFKEDVFSPSVEKPLIPIGEDIKKDPSANLSDIENQITELIKNSEILDDFEIWKEYSTVVDDTSDISEELKEESIKKQEIDFDEELPKEEESDMDWGWSEGLEKDLMEDEEPAEEEDKPSEEIDEAKLKAKMNELAGIEPQASLVEEEDEEEESGEEEPDDEAESEIEEDPFKALENTIIEDTDDSLAEEDLEKIVSDEEVQSDSQAPETNLPKTEAKKFDSKKTETESKGFFAKYKYYLLGIGALIVLYWLFWPSGNEPVEEHIVKEERTTPAKIDSENVIASFEGEKDSSSEETNKEEKQKTVEQMEKSVTVANRNEEPPKVDNKIPQRRSLRGSGNYYKEVKSEKSVGGNIFYDGNEYMIQVSSWRNSIVAQKEVEKLRKKGFDAFVVKAFVKKFNAYFHRVRIGGFASKQEALTFKKKNL